MDTVRWLMACYIRPLVSRLCRAGVNPPPPGRRRHHGVGVGLPGADALEKGVDVGGGSWM
jgi:hypothetical protein